MPDPAAPPLRIAFVVLPSFSHLGLALAIEPLFVVNWLAQARLVEWSVLSLDGLSVRASSGQALPVGGPLADDPGLDAAVVIASFEAQVHARDRRLTGWLRRAARFGAEIGAIETGSEVVAAARLLDGHRAAVHWDNLAGFRERYPDVEAEPGRFTLGHGRMTAAGGTSVLEMMLAWIGARLGPELSAEVAAHLMVGRAGPGTDRGAGLGPDFGPGFDAGFGPGAVAGHGRRPLPDALRRAGEIMAETLDEPLPGPALAARVGLSARQLQRLFRAHLGVGPAARYRQLRLARAHRLLQQTALPVTEIALGCGYGSLEHFSRSYRSAFGRPPREDRRQAIDAPVLRGG